MLKNYDVIVVGGGHAGCEAAYSSAKMDSKVLLVTMDISRLGQMSCNPAMGGVAKGQIIREIDALGGMSGVVSDLSSIQFRMLNKSKGPAMWSPRTQNDRCLFVKYWRGFVEGNKNIDLWNDSVVELILEKEKVVGVKTVLGVSIYSKTVVITCGTFLNGLIHIGESNFSGGRMGEKKSIGITEQLVSNGFETGRMKTGTPPRIDGRSLDYSEMIEQKGDLDLDSFSFRVDSPLRDKEQKSCFITYTNPNVHEVLFKDFERSPLYNGKIDSVGPRYCPSIEDKIVRFKERERHQIFVEPEGWDTVEIYVNGFSTSLPKETQLKALREIKGFENVKMFRPGYAIEYDYFPPTQIKKNMESKIIQNLFLAGQINGTTGYEEAACQGLMAGINAHLKINKKEPFILNRDEAYIGVLIDDLVNKGTEEPYRMFTSRAEHRTNLRQNNADLRLVEKSFKIGLNNESRLSQLNKKKDKIKDLLSFVKKTSISPKEFNPFLKEKELLTLNQGIKLESLLKRNGVLLKDCLDVLKDKKDNPILGKENSRVLEESIKEAEIQIKYEYYIKKEKEFSLKMNDLEKVKIPEGFNYSKFSLSNESKEKLSKILPTNLGEASRVSGVSTADIQSLFIILSKNK